jgi:protoheme IX farnesyltransferase
VSAPPELDHAHLAAVSTVGAVPSTGMARVRAYVELGKPRITAMVLLTTAVGLALAPGKVPTVTTIATLVGMALVVAGANAFNMLLERDTDAKMTRTRRRPLPSGRLEPEAALKFGAVTAALSVPILTFGANPLTGLGGALSLVLYVFVYTPMKRRSATALLVGAIPGAAPPLLGYVAVTNRIDAAALSLFLVLFLWQIPHFIAISLYRTRDYANAGLKTVAGEVGIDRAKERMLLHSLLLVVVSLQVARTGIGTPFYLGCALLLGGGLAALAFYGLTRDAGPRWARWFFLYTLVYLPALYIALLIGR